MRGPRKHLWQLAGFTFGSLAVVAALNAVVDPRDVFRLVEPPSLDPCREKPNTENDR